jgi:hypothetical protein
MRQLTMVLAVATAYVAGVPLSAEAQQVVTVRAMLSGGNEVPGVSTGAHGVATVTVDRSAGRVDYQVDVYNLPTGVTGAHIHVGPAGVNGPIIIDFPVAIGQSGAFRISGSASSSELLVRAPNGIRTFDDAAFAIASGATYVNVHSQAFLGGEIRGQLCPVSAEANVFNGVALCTQ